MGTQFIKIRTLLPLLFVVLFFIDPTSAFADTGQSSAVDTILRSESLEGQDQMRNTIAGYLHKPIGFIITICGFLIITFSFLKVIITLLYLTFPDIFDRIDAYQKQTLQGGFRDKSPIDMISYVFALILPNVKSLTDYANDEGGLEVTPMDYLKKKLPMVILFIIIGAMIFDGQARAFMAKAADVGMLFGNIIERHDTVGAVQDFIGGDTRFQFVYDESKQDGKNNTKIAKAMQSSLHGLNPGLNSQEVSDAIGKFVEKEVPNIAKHMEKAANEAGIKSYKEIVSFKISFTTRPTELSSASKNVNGTMQITIPDDVRDKSPNKYLIIRYSQIRDKDNRNFLFETPKTGGASKNGTTGSN